MATMQEVYDAQAEARVAQEELIKKTEQFDLLVDSHRVVTQELSAAKQALAAIKILSQVDPKLESVHTLACNWKQFSEVEDH